MFQREVALSASSRRRPSAPTTAASPCWRAGGRARGILFDVPPAAFTPPPKVTSSVVELDPAREARTVRPARCLRRRPQAAFGQRRKMLRQSLKAFAAGARRRSRGAARRRRPRPDAPRRGDRRRRLLRAGAGGRSDVGALKPRRAAASSLLRGDLRRARRLQRMVEVGEDVVDVLDADRQAHVAVRHAGGELVLGRKLRVGRRRRMDGELARVADVGDVVEELAARR